MAYTTINKSQIILILNFIQVMVNSAITGVGFQPDLTWINKKRYRFMVNDAVRGAKNLLYQMHNAAEVHTGLNAFDSRWFYFRNYLQLIKF